MSACPAPLWRWGKGSARGKTQRFPGYLGDTVWFGLWVPYLWTTGSSMGCHSAEDSTWASGMGVDPQCKASWLCVSSCRPELKPVDKESEVVMK